MESTHYLASNGSCKYCYHINDRKWLMSIMAVWTVHAYMCRYIWNHTCFLFLVIHGLRLCFIQFWLLLSFANSDGTPAKYHFVLFHFKWRILSVHYHFTKQSGGLFIPTFKTNIVKTCLTYRGLYIWNKKLKLKINLYSSEAGLMKTLKYWVKVGLLTD